MGWVSEVLKPHLFASRCHVHPSNSRYKCSPGRIRFNLCDPRSPFLSSCDINKRSVIDIWMFSVFLSLLSSSSWHLSWRLGPERPFCRHRTGAVIHQVVTTRIEDVPSHSWLRYAVLHLSGSLICVGVLSKWHVASREGWFPQGSHQRQYSHHL